MQAVVFDFDGVIVDSEILHDEALRAVCKPLGIEWHGHPWIGWSDADVLREVFTRAGQSLSESRLTALLGTKTEVVLEQVRAGLYTPYPGSIELMREAAKVAKVAVCSAGMREQIIPVLEHLGVDGLLSALITCEDTKRTKPDPDPYVLAASRLEAAPSRSIAIEDSPRGTRSAWGAGFNVIAVGHTLPRERLVFAHCFAPRTADLSVSMLQALIDNVPPESRCTPNLNSEI